jgi:dephospho-CoA kinase
MNQYIVGVTGGIGAGKSTVADMFARLGAGIVDTDALAHQLTASGGAAIEAIREVFGSQFITSSNSLDRPAMREYVFKNPPARKQLEKILHGRIRESVHQELAKQTAPYILLVVPLLIEVGSYRPLLQRILVVDCEEVLQIQRASLRPGMTAMTVKGILAAQTDRKTRLRAADDVIENNGELMELDRQVHRLDAQYRQWAKEVLG